GLFHDDELELDQPGVPKLYQFADRPILGGLIVTVKEEYLDKPVLATRRLDFPEVALRAAAAFLDELVTARQTLLERDFRRRRFLYGCRRHGGQASRTGIAFLLRQAFEFFPAHGGRFGHVCDSGRGNHRIALEQTAAIEGTDDPRGGELVLVDEPRLHLA